MPPNNEELGQSISEEVGKQVIKEMNYLMREREEAEEDRFRRLDAATVEISAKRTNRKKRNSGKRKSRHKRDGFLLCTKD